MIKRMILINSANFQFADIDLSKEVFFVGDNASGKTTVTRAIHFLYNANGDKLGIPRSKDTFARHYFTHNDSYIIYIFENFFIFTYKQGDTIRRWFSKQKFDIDEIIDNGKLLDIKIIIAYIKKANLKIKPDSIQSYTNILYGKNKEYLDFSIAKIDNYKIFLELFNMIFNIDKAIVTAIDIKKAIQKSLDRRDEVLSIDYEDFIIKLNEFSRAYNFFKAFDSNRENLTNALVSKDGLLSLEDEINLTIKEINFKVKVESKELEELNLKRISLKNEISKDELKVKNIHNLYNNWKKRLQIKVDTLDREIMKIEGLKEKFTDFEIKKNIEFYSKFNSIKTDLEDKKFALKSLQEKFSSAEKIRQGQIKEIDYKIMTIIPNEMNEKIFYLSEVEKTNYEEDKLKISNDYLKMEMKINKDIAEIEEIIDLKKNEINVIESSKLADIKSLRNEFNNQKDILRTNIKTKNNNIFELNSKIENLKVKKDGRDKDLIKNKNKIYELRQSNAKFLGNRRSQLNQEIINAKGILNPIPNSFFEFLTNEIEDWESDIYPIMDKNLLTKSCDELRPKKLDVDTSISFTLNKESLKSIPTKDEAIKILEQAKIGKACELKNSKAIYKEELAKNDVYKNQIIADIESLNIQINDANKIIILENNILREMEKQVDELENTLEKDIDEINKIKYKDKNNELADLNSKLQKRKEELKSEDLPLLAKKRLEAFNDRANKRDENIKKLQIEIESEKKLLIKKEEDKIADLEKNVENNTEDEYISSLSASIKTLDEEFSLAFGAKNYLDEYENVKDEIKNFPIKTKQRALMGIFLDSREKLVLKIDDQKDKRKLEINDKIIQLSSSLEMFEKGINRHKNLILKKIDTEIETKEYLFNLINNYEDLSRKYANEKSKFRTLIDRLKNLEKHSLIDISFNNEAFDEAESISQLSNIIDSLDELDSFEKNKYHSEKKRRHNNFDTFLKNTIPSKLQSFEDLEMDFNKARDSINKSLTGANFGVIKDIRLVTDSSKKRNDTISGLIQQLSKKVNDTVELYSNNSLFYSDIPRSVENINAIQNILESIKEKGSKGMINLFDTIDLTISYTENGKKIENKQNIKDDSSSGGNILLKVAIAMSILNRYAKKTNNDTPFFLIIDEVSKLQSKNQKLIKEYINSNGFKTLFITPDPAFPDPDKAIYYTFKNIQEEGESLEVRQMNIF